MGYNALSDTHISANSVHIGQSGNTTLLEWCVDGLSQAWLQLSVSGQALDAFALLGKCHPDASYETFHDQAGDFLSPSVVGLIIDASGDLTTLEAGASGWLCIDVSGLYSIKITASSSNAAGSSVSVYGGAS